MEKIKGRIVTVKLTEKEINFIKSFDPFEKKGFSFGLRAILKELYGIRKQASGSTKQSTGCN